MIAEIKTRWERYGFQCGLCIYVCVSSMVEVEEVYNKKGAELSEVVRPIREVNRKHQQVMYNCDSVCVLKK